MYCFFLFFSIAILAIETVPLFSTKEKNSIVPEKYMYEFLLLEQTDEKNPFVADRAVIVPWSTQKFQASLLPVWLLHFYFLKKEPLKSMIHTISALKKTREKDILSEMVQYYIDVVTGPEIFKKLFMYQQGTEYDFDYDKAQSLGVLAGSMVCHFDEERAALRLLWDKVLKTQFSVDQMCKFFSKLNFLEDPEKKHYEIISLLEHVSDIKNADNVVSHRLLLRKMLQNKHQVYGLFSLASLIGLLELSPLYKRAIEESEWPDTDIFVANRMVQLAVTDSFNVDMFAIRAKNAIPAFMFWQRHLYMKNRENLLNRIFIPDIVSLISHYLVPHNDQGVLLPFIKKRFLVPYNAEKYIAEIKKRISLNPQFKRSKFFEKLSVWGKI